MYDKFVKWIDNLNLEHIPDEVEAFCFNLYDGCDNEHWSMELIGADSYDRDDSDWACGEVCDFCSREPEFEWERTAKWDVVLEEIVSMLREYLENGKYANTLKSRVAVAVGFTDGDLEILFSK